MDKRGTAFLVLGSRERGRLHFVTIRLERKRAALLSRWEAALLSRWERLVSMLTKEQLERVIFSEFETLCAGVAASKSEFVTAQLDDPKSGLSVKYAAKKAAADEYKKAENAYLLQTSVGETQTLVLLKAAARFATEKIDKGFLLWLQSNGVLLSVDEVVTDTPTRLLSWLNNTFDAYIRGKKEAINKKKAGEEKKAAALAAVEELKASGLSLDEVIAAFGK